MILVTKEDVDNAVEHPKIYRAAELAHIAWCEQLDREKPGWGSQYLIDFVNSPRPINKKSIGVRVRVASVLAVVKELGADPNDLMMWDRKPVVTEAEIKGNLLNPFLFRMMTLANDAWDDEAFREEPLTRDAPSFAFKYRNKLKSRNDPRCLFAASQLAVLRCIPSIEIGETYVLRRPGRVLRAA